MTVSSDAAAQRCTTDSNIGKRKSAEPLLVLEQQPEHEVGRYLMKLGVPLLMTYDVAQARKALRDFSPSEVVLGLEHEGMAELELVREATAVGARVIVVGRLGSDDLVNQALALGASEFLTRPVTYSRLWAALGGEPDEMPPIDEESHESGKDKPQPEPPPSGALDDLKRSSCRSRQMKALLEQVTRVAPTMATVLITGESGTGKEITARAIHDQSPRYAQPFIPVNCGAIPSQLIESELFGHERGSFTGAVKSHKGLFERADGGTLFLDEITEMPVELQVKLLRVLETHKFSRVGSERELHTDVRVIAATNRDPDQEVADGHLRADLLYRLRVFPIELPALRERKDDIRHLAQHFLDLLNQSERSSPKQFTDSALDALEAYDWPGNLRELKNIVRRLHIMAPGQRIDVDQLPEELFVERQPVRRQGDRLVLELGCSVEELERGVILETLAHCDGRKEAAAKVLGISAKTLYNRLKRYNQLDFMSRKSSP